MWWHDIYLIVNEFLYKGGPVVSVIGVTCILMWALMLERVWFYSSEFPRLEREVHEKWHSRKDKSSWNAYHVREFLIWSVAMKLRQSLGLIKTMVMICPLLGLLGTVTGMIEVFEVISFMGSSNARAMAAGISKATIPTMVGMFVALTGIIGNSVLQQYARRHELSLINTLEIEHITYK
ncbi:MAG: biopolymer transporter ExbB [Gammaproteobacteria bacterium]|nr:MAG: biopolymer transporter ExbB [Gammaproteobacteria bacterium]